MEMRPHQEAKGKFLQGNDGWLGGGGTKGRSKVMVQIDKRALQCWGPKGKVVWLRHRK